MFAALIKNGVVTQVGIMTEGQDLEDGWIATKEKVGKGFTYDGEAFTPPPPAPEPTAEIPDSVSRLQFATALMAAEIITAKEAEDWAGGNAIPAIASAAIDGSKMSAVEKAAARIAARGAVTIPRDSGLVMLLQAAKKMTDAQVDALFTAAAQVNGA